MPMGIKHMTEPTTRAERAALKEEQMQWRAMDKRVEELEVAVRAALSFVQERFSDQGTYSDGHAQMVAMALRGALRNS